MTIEQTIEIPDNHRVFFDLPRQVPSGKARVVLRILDYPAPDEVEAFATEEEASEFADRLSRKIIHESW
jgi:hypothetical protein